MKISVDIATGEHVHFIPHIRAAIDQASASRGTGIAKRSHEYLKAKIDEGKAIIAHIKNRHFVGFCYIETWEGETFVANSGLVVNNDYRGIGIAKKIKKAAFRLSRKKYPNAKIFGLTTGLAVMKINTDLGYVPVTFSEITTDEKFWKGCETCNNHDILVRTERRDCLCTGMLFDPAYPRSSRKAERKGSSVPGKRPEFRSPAVIGRWLIFKKNILFKNLKHDKNNVA